MTDRLIALTIRQRECLRGKWDRKLDKAIAVELGISQRAVEEHLRVARERLGVGSSVEAAQIAAAAFGWCPTVPPQCGPTELPICPEGSIEMAPHRGGAMQSENAVRDVHWGSQVSPGLLLSWPLRRRGERNNGLSTSERITWIIAIAIGIPVATVSVLAMSDYVGRLVTDVARLFS